MNNMSKAIERILNDREFFEKEFKLEKLDDAIHHVLKGYEFTMKYDIEYRQDTERALFVVTSTDLVSQSGIFQLALTKCNLDTFGSGISYSDEFGYKCWFDLALEYKHFQGGQNGMTIAKFHLDRIGWHWDGTKKLWEMKF